MKKCCFIIPYFGKFNNYFPLFLKTCAWNKDFNWLVVTDDNTKYDYPDNFKIVKMTFSDFKSLVQSKFDFPIALSNPYKLCDYKPAYGYILEEYLTEYKFWGHCDVDVLMGCLSNFITDDILARYDKIFCLGHMVLYKNTKENNRVFMSGYKDYLYKKVFSTNEICWFDEEYKDDRNINRLFFFEKKKVFTKDFSFNIPARYTQFRRSEYLGFDVYPFNHGYKVEQKKKAVYLWKEGRIIRMYKVGASLFEEEFLYMHFLRRNMKMNSLVFTGNVIQIVPNSFLPLEVDDINSKNFESIKRIVFNTQYFHIHILPKIKKIKKLLHI